MATSPLISCRQVVKTYRSNKKSVHALRSVSLDIPQGCVFALLGANGAGKTTLSSIIATLAKPTSGDILYKGVSIYHDLADYRRHIGICPQTTGLGDSLTIEQHLFYQGLYYGLSQEASTNRTNELIKQFTLEQYRASKPSELSGGYRQRLVIARSLVHNPELLILDEPTVGLDPHARRNLWDVIRDLRSKGMSIILTTHYLDEAQELADHVCIIDKGQVKTIATPKELMSLHNKQNLEEVFVELMNSSCDASPSGTTNTTKGTNV
ncbi:MAG: Daunorubicin resistance ABC transporter ATPase subunit [candidate division TM6 bacterium GW2011_GWE2_41_16]|nr:MAG: Daunorubicin resistance ABC transporter ATPase subunit [candidate division TM6 bacterium GW2011_GWE2_41_16]